MKFLLFTILSIFLSPFISAHTFEVTYAIPEKKPVYTPRVYIAMSKGFRSPRTRMSDWANLPILFAIDDEDRDGKVTIDAKALGTMSMEELEGTLKVQAIVRINPDWMLPGSGEGDLYSKAQKVEFIKGEQLLVNFDAGNIVEAPEFRAEGPIQDHYFKSKKLSEFHKRDYNMRYSVILPEDWDRTKKYPVIIYVTGFSAVHNTSTRRIKRQFGDKGKQAIIVIADANCRWGHSVFANSVVNGPWGDALTYELLPHIDDTYGGAGADHRYITGVSSGGWTAAWAIITYPEAYAEAWPVSPDPVDFEKFQELNLVDREQDNLFLTTEQEEKVARCISLPAMGWTYENMATFEHVLGAGGQLLSFGAVFSPKTNEAGEPDAWYNIETGKVDMKVTDSWKPYDISTKMEENWTKLAPRVKGKIHFGIHQTDIFHLDHSVRLLEKTCQKLGSDATFTYFEGIGHHMTKEYIDKMMNSILKRWTEKRPIQKSP